MSQKPEENRHPQDDVTDESQQGEEQREESIVEGVGVVEEELLDNSAAFEQRVEALEAELSDAKDQALRAAAEAQNSRRRATQDVEKARKFALEKFVKDLLPVADSLEKALDTMQSQGTEDVHLEGVKMTRDMLQSTLQKQGVEVFDPQGEPFDPQYHEAMTMVPNPEVEPNTVIDVMQKGYSLNGRVVRPAMVVVSKAP